MKFRATVQLNGKTATGIQVPDEVVVPADFAAALDEQPDARHAFEKLSYSHKRQHVLAIEDAKTAETRQRRIAKSLGMLLEG